MAEKKMCSEKSKMEIPAKKGGTPKAPMMKKGEGMKMAEKLSKKAKK
jgi:hypothetical protein